MSKPLSIDKAVDKHLKPVKDSDGTMTALEVSTDAVRVKDLVVSGTATGITHTDATKHPLTTVGIADDNLVEIDDADAADNDYAKFTANGLEGRSYAEVLSDIEALPLAGGTMTGDLNIAATDKITFDGGGNTYITESATDQLDIHSGSATAHMEFMYHGSYARSINFGDTDVGFTQGTGNNDSGTDWSVGFRSGMKQMLTFGAASIDNITMFMPKHSANCVLVLKQDGTGSRTVADWDNVKAADGTAATSADVKWAGGSAPTLSTGANAIDIISFYWDATNEVAYGVASLNFS